MLRWPRAPSGSRIHHPSLRTRMARVPGHGAASWEHRPREEAEGFWDRLLSPLPDQLPTFLGIIFSSQEHSHGKAGAGLVFTRAPGLAGARQPPCHQRGGTRAANGFAKKKTNQKHHIKTQQNSASLQRYDAFSLSALLLRVTAW